MIEMDVEEDGSLSVTIIWYTDIASKIVTATNMYSQYALSINFPISITFCRLNSTTNNKDDINGGGSLFPKTK